MEYDTVLGQQSISGKNISLILCVWKPCYVKSGHILTCKLMLMYLALWDYGEFPVLFSFIVPFALRFVQ